MEIVIYIVLGILVGLGSYFFGAKKTKDAICEGDIDLGEIADGAEDVLGGDDKDEDDD